MRYATSAAFDVALSARIRRSPDGLRMRQRIAFDRVLARLVAAAPDAFLLKGGAALDFRLATARSTRDIDLSARASFAEVDLIMQRAATIQLNDYFALRYLRAGTVDFGDDVLTVRRYYYELAFAHGKKFEGLHVDVGIADPWLGDPIDITGSTDLAFAGIEPAVVRGIPVAQAIAEKLHAYTRTYGSSENSRVKDLVDLVLDLRDGPPAGLGETIASVFRARASHPVPAAFPLPPASWEATYRTQYVADEVLRDSIPTTIAAAHGFVASALEAALTIAIERTL